jgi:hypothetical protein
MATEAEHRRVPAKTALPNQEIIDLLYCVSFLVIAANLFGVEHIISASRFQGRLMKLDWLWLATSRTMTS